MGDKGTIKDKVISVVFYVLIGTCIYIHDWSLGGAYTFFIFFKLYKYDKAEKAAKAMEQETARILSEFDEAAKKRRMSFSERIPIKTIKQ